jgi:hypothetical protein
MLLLVPILSIARLLGLTAVLQIQVLWDVTLCRRMNSFCRFKDHMTLQMTVVRCFETSGATHLIGQCL